MRTIDEVKALVGALPAADVPIAFLPIQIQTRYVTEDGTPRLLVRIYPDDLHLDSHEEALTAAEAEWGRNHWTLTWASARDAAAQRRSWEALAKRFGGLRAAWIVRRMTPANLGQRPGIPPVFPDPGPPREAFDVGRVQARMLPERWVVTGFRAGARVLLEVGAPIPEDLRVGLSAEETPDAPPPDDRLALDPGLRWLVDFDAAVEAGMAVRAADPGALDTLLVFGIRGAQDPATGAARLEEMLGAHRFTRGLAFIPPGTPTNNSPEESSGLGRHGPDLGALMELETHPPRLAPETDGALTARLLGLRTQAFTSVAGADGTEELTARQVGTALWPATGGYYLNQMLGKQISGTEPLEYEQLDRARGFFLGHVRHQGPMPALRVGRQPYGLLPAVSLDLHTTGSARQLARMLRMLRAAWRSALPRVPRLRPGERDEEVLIEILRSQPVSVGHRARLAVEATFFTAGGELGDELDADLATHLQALLRRTDELGEGGAGFFWRTSTAIPGRDTRLLGGALVQPGDETALTPDYVSFLRTATFDDVLRERLPAGDFPDGAPDTLFYRLLRHSVLLAEATTADRILTRRDPVGFFPHVESSLIDVQGGAQPFTTRTVLRTVAEDPALRAVLHRLGAADEPEGVLLEELRAALLHLATVPVDALARHLCGTLDLFAHRLDAWITALATQRLDAIRGTRPRGLVLGGFGWLHDLRPNPRTPVTSVPRGEEDGPLFTSTEPGGHILAPSMAHAAAGAMLRSGHLAGIGDDDARPFEIDLRSARMRLARTILDGVRAGQPLAELLGRRFERDLHEHGLDRFIDGCRRVSRLAGVYAATTAAQRERRLEELRQRYAWPAGTALPAAERLAAARVADGLSLAQRFLADTLPFDRIDPDPGTRGALSGRLRGLADAVDAVSDALTAEGVYQLARGNPARAAATLDAVAHGDIAPPDPEIARTPRPGIQQTHRVVVLLGSPGQAPPGDGPRRARTAAEPAVDGWLRPLLGPLGEVEFRAEYVLGDQVVASSAVRLDRLGVTHLDLLYLTAGPRPGEVTDLERLLRHDLLRRAPDTVPADAGVRLVRERPPGLPRGRLGLGEFLETLRAFRETVLAARGLDGRDLAPGDAAPDVDAAELAGRTDRSVAALATAADRLAAASAAAEAAEDPSRWPVLLDDLRERLVDLLMMGLPEAVPVSARGAGAADREGLLGQAGAVLDEARRRSARVAALDAGFDRAAAAPEQRVRHDQDRLRAVFGSTFVALPLVRPGNAADLAATFADSAALQDGDPVEAVRRLQVVSRVRPGASRLLTALTYAAALGRPGALEPRAGQLPYEPGDRWIALPDPPDGAYPPGKLSLVAHLPQPLRPQGPMAGLLIDEWVDTVPSPEVTTGLAFHYESPGARPPQSAVLAVTPPGAATWEIDTIERTLLETMELATLRALDPQALADEVLFHRALPALYVSLNLAGDTLSTDFTTLE